MKLAPPEKHKPLGPHCQWNYQVMGRVDSTTQTGRTTPLSRAQARPGFYWTQSAWL